MGCETTRAQAGGRWVGRMGGRMEDGGWVGGRRADGGWFIYLFVVLNGAVLPEISISGQADRKRRKPMIGWGGYGCEAGRGCEEVGAAAAAGRRAVRSEGDR